MAYGNNVAALDRRRVTAAKIVEVSVVKRCPNCGRRLCDKLGSCTGMIEIKCQKCGRVAKGDLALRKAQSGLGHE